MIRCLKCQIGFKSASNKNRRGGKKKKKEGEKKVPPERIELPTPGLQDQCSATELQRHLHNNTSVGGLIKKEYRIRTLYSHVTTLPFVLT